MSALKPTILTGAYNRESIQKLFKHPYVKEVHYLLQNWNEYPRNSKINRVELEIREHGDIRDSNERIANLFELVWFSIKNPYAILDCEKVEGFDENMEKVGKDLNMALTVPFCVFSGNGINVSLDRNDRRRAQYCVVATCLE